MKYRKFKKSDIKDIIKIRNNVFAEFCKNDYYEKSAIDWYLGQINVDSTEEKLIKEMHINSDSICYVAEEIDKLVGFINGRKNRIGSLFVLGKSHGKGVGKKLLELFEKDAILQGTSEIKIRSSIYAVPFYQKNGYKKTTGVRNIHGLKIQPMKKIFN